MHMKHRQGTPRTFIDTNPLYINYGTKEDTSYTRRLLLERYLKDLDKLQVEFYFAKLDEITSSRKTKMATSTHEKKLHHMVSSTTSATTTTAPTIQETSYDDQALESTTTTKSASPSLEATMEAEKTMELFKNSSSDDGDKVKNGEHGIFPSPKEAHGVEETEPIPICLSDDMVPIPCEHESHLAHLSESKSELSDSTICEFECFLFEGMSDTPSEMRVVVDRSCEAISISNNLPSTSSVLSTCDTGWPTANTISCTSSSPEVRSLKYDVIEAWKRRKIKVRESRGEDGVSRAPAVLPLTPPVLPLPTTGSGRYRLPQLPSTTAKPLESGAHGATGTTGATPPVLPAARVRAIQR